MSAQPFDVQAVIDRLKTSVTTLRKVAGAADYATLRSLGDFNPPAAYVLLAREKAEPSAPGNGLPGSQSPVRQRVVVTFGVVLAVRNYREQQGMQVQDALRDTLAAVRSALLGWVPNTTGARACQLLQGDLTQYDAATLLWTDVWQTQHIIGSEP